MSDLLSTLQRLEQQGLAALVRFSDGSAYELQVLSTMHAEEGGDIVADVLRVIVPEAAGDDRDWRGKCMNFLLSDVVEVTVGSQRVYSVARPAAPGASAERSEH